MHPTLLSHLTDPGGGPPLRVASVAHTEGSQIIRGAAFSERQGLYPIREGILDLLPNGTGPLSPAQGSNRLEAVARGYEWPWRTHSLSLLSGERLPFEREQAILREMLGTVEGGLWLDLAASTALYARWLRPWLGGRGEIVALDVAWPMLRAAQRHARREGQEKAIGWVRGRGEALPFATGSLTGVLCGGSLNEFGETGASVVLNEVARALRPGGTALFMHLLRVGGGRGLFQRRVAEPGGIAFWSAAESIALFEQAGLQVEESRVVGMVAFTRLRRAF